MKDKDTGTTGEIVTKIIQIAREYKDYAENNARKIKKFYIPKKYQLSMSSYLAKPIGPGVTEESDILQYLDTEKTIIVDKLFDIPVEFLENWEDEGYIIARLISVNGPNIS